MLKIKFVLLLMLLFFIVDSKKLRNKLKNKTRCGDLLHKCGTFFGGCCTGFKCIDSCFLFFCSGTCFYDLKFLFFNK